MRIEQIQAKNFRSLVDFDLSIAGDSIVLVSENGAGKSSLIQGIAKALGKDRSAHPLDFTERSDPIEIVLTLTDFDRKDQSCFPKELSFVGVKPKLRIGFRAVWDPSEENVDTTFGFPDDGWRRASKAQRDALGAVWLSASRDPGRLLQLATNQGYWPQLLAGIKIDKAVSAAIKEVQHALERLTSNTDLGTLLGDLSAALSGIIPDVQAGAFSLGVHAADSEKELLREFDLLISHGGPPLPVFRQSNGLAQLTLFLMALRVLSADPKSVLLIDEPEISLHPQAQRALSTAIRKLPNQAIIATHSSNILDRADMRTVIRLHRAHPSVSWARAFGLSKEEAERLSRFVNPITAEGAFARKVVLVEGYSDRVFLLQLASRMSRDLDAEGVTIISMDGGCGIGTHLRLFGGAGLKLHVLGICDEDKEVKWQLELAKAGLPVTDRRSMTNQGFFVIVKDLEEAIVRSLGTTQAMAVIISEGEHADFATYQKQPAQRSLLLEEQLRSYFHKESTRWAIPLADALNPKTLPSPLDDFFKTI